MASKQGVTQGPRLVDTLRIKLDDLSIEEETLGGVAKGGAGQGLGRGDGGGPGRGLWWVVGPIPLVT